jgi:hypothetical protein
MDKINRLMFERVADIHLLSIGKILGNSNLTLAEKMNYLRAVEVAYKTYGSISIYDMNGRKIGDTRNVLIGINESQMPFFEHAIRGEIYYDKIPVMSVSLNQYVLHFSAPIYDNKGKINGVVVTSYPLNKLNDVLHVHFQTDLVSSNGLLIYSNYDKQSIMQKNVSDSKIFRLLTKSTATTTNSTIENRMGQDFVLVGLHQTKGFLDYKGSGWYLILGDDAQDLFSEVQKDYNLLVLSTGIILAVAVAIAFLFAGSTLMN